MLPSRLLLVGIAIGFGAEAAMLLLSLRMSFVTYSYVASWMAGTLAAADWKSIRLLLPCCAVLIPIACSRARVLNVFALGDNVAASLGVSVQRERMFLLTVATVLTSACVAIGGHIAFLGLVAPHLARRVIGQNHILLFPTAARCGAILLVAGDSLGRHLFAPSKYPPAYLSESWAESISCTSSQPPEAETTVMIQLHSENLALAYDENEVIRDLSLSIPSQQITALVGPNGSGKSTLLRGLARLMKPERGAVYLDGQAIHQMPTREVARQLAVLPQRPEAPDGLVVRELVAFGRFPYQGFLGIATEEDDRRIDAALEITGLDHLADRLLGELSGGQRQLAWIAMALAQDTQLLLLDEPTTFLDMAHQLDVLDVLARLHRDDAAYDRHGAARHQPGRPLRPAHGSPRGRPHCCPRHSAKSSRPAS